MREMELCDIQKASLAVLKKIDSLCEQYEIKYWVMYGTLIGAVRHNGYIPWDDDVDIAMPRKDYERFIDIINNNRELLSPFELHTYQTKENYPYFIPRVCDNDHVIRFHNKDYTSGVFVDIYPHDGMGNDKKYWYGLEKEINRLKKHLTLSTYNKSIYGRTIITKILNMPNLVYSKMKGRLYFLEKMDSNEQAFGWEESKYVGIPSWDPTIRFLKKEWFDSIIKMPFEDMMVPVPEKYDEVLTLIYGDYMKLPPEKDRVPHHDYKAYSLNK